MKIILSVIVPWLLFGFSTFCTADEGAKITCIGETGGKGMEKDERILEIKEPTGGGCELHYTKSGDAKVIAQAKHQLNICSEVQKKVSKKLEDSGFKCQ